MKTIFFAIIIVIATLNANAQWGYLGLGNTCVTDLTIYSDTIYASTYDGIYKKNIIGPDTIWIPCGQQGNHVVQTLVPNFQTFICVIEITSTNTTLIYKSTDGGITFSLMNPDTSNFNSYQYLGHIAHPEGNYDTLYFLNHQLKTFDGGTSWDTIYNVPFTDRFIMVNPENNSQLLIGGETGFFTAYLQVSSDYGNNWSYPGMSSYFMGDNSVHDIAIDGNKWFAAGEGVIAKSTNNGNTWGQLLNLWGTTISPFNLYYTIIEFSPVNKNILYVSGCKSENTNTDLVPLLYSVDQGVTWDSVSYNSSFPFQGITCLTIKNTAGSDKVFLGGRGVYFYENHVLILKELPDEESLKIYPNPFNSKTTFSFTIPAESNIELVVFNIMGQKIKTLINSKLIKGKHSVVWDGTTDRGEPVGSGTYFYHIQTGNYTETKKCILLK